MSEEEEDWFERALRERPGSDEEDGAADDETASDDSPDGEDATTDGADAGTAADADDGRLFEDDFAAALDDVELPPDVDGEDGQSTGGDDAFGGDDPAFGGDDAFGGEGDADFGMGGGAFDTADEFGMRTDDDFDTGADFGMGGVDFGMGGATTDEFDEQEFESELPRVELGIRGLDQMIQGGIPERSLMVAIGSAGTGKTTFGIQFLDKALRDGDRAVFITLEETKERVINSAVEKGMAFDEYDEEGRLAVVDLDPVEMANSLNSIQSELPRLIEEFGATRLVLDSVSLLEMMYDDTARRRNEIYDFTKSLKAAGVTTMLTSEASEETPYASRHGIVEYLTDAVFVLQYVRPSDFRETRLAVEIQKIRDANHSRETKPYEITSDGINVYRQANIF